MASGSFLLSVMRNGSSKYGKLQHFDYDDASRFKKQRREKVLMAARMACDGWRRNHWGFRDASFRIEELGPESRPILIYGQRYTKKHPAMPTRFFN